MESSFYYGFKESKSNIFFLLLEMLIIVKGIIFILNPNLTSLSFYESWSFNIVSEPGLLGVPGFKPPLCNLFPIC